MCGGKPCDEAGAERRPVGIPAPRLSRRDLLHAAGSGTMGLAMGGIALGISGSAAAAPREPVPGTLLPRGAALRVKPALVYQIPTRQEKTSWRWYGGIQTMDEVHREAKRLQKDMQELAAKSDFPIEFLRWNWSAVQSRPSRQVRPLVMRS